MKVGVIGLGSMGKRRARDLKNLGCDVSGFDILESRCREAEELLAIRALKSFEALQEAGIEAAVISTPPDVHVDYYEKCFAGRLPFFSEAGIFTPKPEWFREREEKSGVRGYASATWKHHPLFQLCRKIVRSEELGAVHSVHYHYGGYLPSWHPWEDYTSFYAGRSKTAAAREMVPFELEWMTDVFGAIESVSAVTGQFAKWKADFPDSFFLHLRFASGLNGTLNIELHQPAPFRHGVVSCANGALKLDLLRHEIRQYQLGADSWKIRTMPGLRVMSSFNFEEIYFREIEAFHRALSGQAPYPKTWEEDRHLSDVLYASEVSAREERRVRIAEVADQYSGITWD